MQFGASGLIVSYQGASREVKSEGLAEHCQHMTMPKVKAGHETRLFVHVRCDNSQFVAVVDLRP